MAMLFDAKTGQILFEQVTVAETFLRRAIGLLGKSTLPNEAALLIRPCNSIHTCCMRMNLNVAFCDADGIVLRVATQVRPWRICVGPRNSRFALEWSIDAGCPVHVGQQIRVA